MSRAPTNDINTAHLKLVKNDLCATLYKKKTQYDSVNAEDYSQKVRSNPSKNTVRQYARNVVKLLIFNGDRDYT